MNYLNKKDLLYYCLNTNSYVMTYELALKLRTSQYNVLPSQVRTSQYNVLCSICTSLFQYTIRSQ